ncbi:peroxisomal protein, putative [Bodo saltans]|uniref:Peroxisomal protein, putative n=1 Tax=Bodo saltans TaxID=75058 RepID=A0A0S4JM85_BODSA|nr:peroxisomal protein, putative [Bodo saltans]|eukprot:CUG90492.1 peroxisomal protein, putative [Bodo saltans]
MGILSEIWSRYQWSLLNRPYITNAMTSSTIALFGDTMAQTVFRDVSGQPRVTRAYLEERHIPTDSKLQFFSSDDASATVLDLRRSFIFASFTVVIGTPLWLRLYKSLDKFIPAVTIASSIQKGMMSWIFANSTMPFFIAYLTVLDQFIVHRKRPSWMTLTPPPAAISSESTAGLSHNMNHQSSAGVVGVVLAKVIKDMPVMMSYSICFWSIQWIPMFYLMPPHFRLVYGSMLQIVWSGITSYLLHRGDAPTTIHEGQPKSVVTS